MEKFNSLQPRRLISNFSNLNSKNSRMKSVILSHIPYKQEDEIKSNWLDK
ncbi:hypothetical protein EW15_1410 [Prochlorococcus sp. MIT 0801]|nr:hypothetical protein EW15_1410 [Prochlorococcus sp. MIT 0801]